MKNTSNVARNLEKETGDIIHIIKPLAGKQLAPHVLANINLRHQSTLEGEKVLMSLTFLDYPQVISNLFRYPATLNKIMCYLLCLVKNNNCEEEIDVHIP